MAPSQFSPTTSISSHTLSAQSVQPPPHDLHPHSSQSLISTLSASQHSFLQPTTSLHSASLVLAKRFLDPLAAGVSEARAARQEDARRKRKRGERDTGRRDVLGLKKVHLEGFRIEQVWEQARRVLDATREEVEDALNEVQLEEVVDVAEAVNDDYVDPSELDEEDIEAGSSDEDTDGQDISDGDESEALEDGFNNDDEEDESYLNGQPVEGESGMDEELDASDESAGAELVEDPNGLNDGFFSIDDFNRQSRFLERQDARGDLDDGAASDEEDIDWTADPLTIKANGERTSAFDGDEQASDDEEAGPTFGNADLNAPEGESDEDEIEDVNEASMGLGDMVNTNDIMYKQFFAPPAKKGGKKKQGRPRPRDFPEKNGRTDEAEEPEDDIQRTISAVHRGIFSDSDPADSDDPLSDVDPGDPKSRRSTHERRQAKIAEEIRRLEAANVAKREWTLAGEAQAADRPLNSLLEEDLDFERTGKPVPVITAEVSEDIEALIKRRILAQEFDEVIRRRPDDLATGQRGVRRGRFELEDTKNAQSLAELYEEEHLRRTDPNYVDRRDEALRKEHAEIERLWKDASARLDALCSLHYRPKPPSASLDIRADVPAITMEDARPSAGGDMGSASMLAPQEVYRPGEEKSKAEVVTKGGMPVAREEMTREQKLRRRRREKERIRKAGGNADRKGESKAAKEEREVFGNLKKGGVKRIGKEGELADVEGKAVNGSQRKVVGGTFKL